VPTLIVSRKGQLAEILVYKRNGAPFLRRHFSPHTATVSHDPSRKRFLARLLGAAASMGLVSRAVASSAPAAVVPSAAGRVSPVVLRPETRAVARRAGAV
jgi:hypothetical protein